MERGQATSVFFFWSVIYHIDHWDEALLRKSFVDFHQPWYPEFNPSIAYYSGEMGDSSHLKRLLFYSNTIALRSSLVELKKISESIENSTGQNYKRTINIDPGYVALEQVVLSTSKPYSHRIHIQDGIYADLVYIFQNKNYHVLPWTYPDYQEIAKINYFLNIRQALQRNL